MSKVKKGIGGILIFIAIDLGFRPISYIIRIIRLSVISVFTADYIAEIVKLLIYSAIFVLAVAASILFFTKKRAFKICYIILLWADIAFSLFFSLLMLKLFGETNAASLGWTMFFGLSAVMWTIYILTSKRVKNTFIN